MDAWIKRREMRQVMRLDVGGLSMAVVFLNKTYWLEESKGVNEMVIFLHLHSAGTWEFCFHVLEQRGIETVRSQIYKFAGGGVAWLDR